MYLKSDLIYSNKIKSINDFIFKTWKKKNYNGFDISKVLERFLSPYNII